MPRPWRHQVLPMQLLGLRLLASCPPSPPKRPCMGPPLRSKSQPIRDAKVQILPGPKKLDGTELLLFIVA